MEEYKSNSHKSRQNQNDDIPEKRVEKVVSGSVKSKKKNGLQKITMVEYYHMKTVIKDVTEKTIKKFGGR